MKYIYDCHYDLLTYVLMKKEDPAFLVNLCKGLYNSNNIMGGLINTYYMLPSNMKEELGIDNLNVIDHFKTVNDIIDKYDLLPNKEMFLRAIEGCSYIKKDDLKTLYELGLRSIILVYNEDNQYGGGAFGDIDRGLTREGIELIDEALRLNIIIDVSHLNHKTANEVLDYLLRKKEEGLNPIVIASHSNAYSLVNKKRNITDEIIKKIGLLDGMVGIVARKSFCYDQNTNDYDKYFAAHIRYVSDLIGIDKVGVASDDMDYHPDKEYQDNAMYKVENFGNSVYNALTNNGFSDIEINMVMRENFQKVLTKAKRNN